MSSIHPTEYRVLTYNGISQFFPQKCDCDFFLGISTRRHLVHSWYEKIHHMRRKRKDYDRSYDDHRLYSLRFSEKMAVEKERLMKEGFVFSEDNIDGLPNPHDPTISKATIFEPGRKIRRIIDDMKYKSCSLQMQKMDWESTATTTSPKTMITPPDSPHISINGRRRARGLVPDTITPPVWGPPAPLDFKNEWDRIGYGPRDQRSIDIATLSRENCYGEKRKIIIPSIIDDLDSNELLAKLNIAQSPQAIPQDA